MTPIDVAPLRDFVRQITNAIDQDANEARLLPIVKLAMSVLCSKSNWLAPAYWATGEPHYQQYLLHCDPRERFAVISMVCAPGQATPVHDHTVWGVIGILSGAELVTSYSVDMTTGESVEINKALLEQGSIEAVSPILGDWHQVSNGLITEPSVSIHIYGSNIGATPRHTLNRDSRTIKRFVSTYNNSQMPNLWDRSAQIRRQIET